MPGRESHADQSISGWPSTTASLLVVSLCENWLHTEA
jgi:hypothetical protein